MLSGIWLPIVTPLRSGEVDIDALQRLADYYLRTEISGFVALSTTGEAALLQEAERLTVLQALTDVIGSRLPMLIGVGKECVKEHFDKLSGLPINVLCGTDEAFDDCLHHGGTGGILASAHVCADLLVAVQELLRAKHDMGARSLFASLLPVLRLLFAAPNPSAIKAMLAFDHLLTDQTRMPITRASAQLVERLSTARDRLQDLRAEFAGAMN
jgi:dihydrodipicolinate synthase/N-acetylneuraminate lyase